MRFLLAATMLVASGPAWANPTPLGDPYASPQPLGFGAQLVPFVTVPAEQASAPAARIQYVTPAPDHSGRLFINDLNGVLYRTDQAGATPTPYLDLNQQNVGSYAAPVPSGPGLMGVAFNPNFNGDPAKPGYGVFYTSSTVLAPSAAPTIGPSIGDTLNEIREWTTADPSAGTFQGTSRVVMRLSGSGGTIAFNPTAVPGSADYGNLYVGVADFHDNGAGLDAQNLGLPDGKILRINPAAGPAGQAYTIPSDNPYASTAGALPEIWASGMRYPQSFGWDSVTGTMYINEIGEANFEEVNVGQAGANYGYPLRQSTFGTTWDYDSNPGDYAIYPFPDGVDHSQFTDPVGTYDHQDGFALGSGFLYRGVKFPALYGKYLMEDIVTGRIFVFDPEQANAGQAPLSVLPLTFDGETADLNQIFGYGTFINSPRVDARLSEDADGEPLIALKATGVVYALEPIPEPGTALLLAGLLPLSLRRRAR